MGRAPSDTDVDRAPLDSDGPAWPGSAERLGAPVLAWTSWSRPAKYAWYWTAKDAAASRATGKGRPDMLAIQSPSGSESARLCCETGW